MSGTTTLNLGGAELTVETSALFRAWFEKHMAPAVKSALPIPPARAGERYVGSIVEQNGTRVRHIFLLPGDDKKNWKDGLEWAKEQGGDLPDRVEQALLHATAKEEFQEAAYWSNTQLAGTSYYAWCQSFGSGTQSGHYENDELRVRAVRREFSDLVI